jgi:hypothetical protein
MLPLILERIDPDKSIKDRIARKVYRLKDTSPDIFIDNISKNDSDTNSSAKEVNQIPPKDLTVPEKQIEVLEEIKINNVSAGENSVKKNIPEINKKKEDKPQSITERFEKITTLADDTAKDDIVLTQRKLDIPVGDKRPKKNREIKPPEEYEQMIPVPEPAATEEPEKRNKFFTILLILITAVTMTGSAFIYIKYSSENDKYAEQVVSMNAQLNNLNEEAASYKNIISIIESENFKMINLNSLKNDSLSFARILLDGTGKSAYLQIKLSNKISSGQSLNLLSISDGGKNLLLTFSSDNENHFHHFNLTVPDVSTEIIFAVTNSQHSDSSASADSLLFTGSFLYTPGLK